MAGQRNLEELTFKEIGEVIKRTKEKVSHRGKNKIWEQDSTLMSLLYNSYTDRKKELDIANSKDLASVKWPQKMTIDHATLDRRYARPGI